MATFTAKLYGKLFVTLFNKELQYTDSIKVQLHTVTYVPDQDVHDYKDDLTNELSTAGGYTVGGVALGSKVSQYTGATNKYMFDAADVVWTTFTATFRVAVIVDTTPATDATRPLLGYQLADVDVVGAGGDFTLQWNSGGIIEITVG